MRRRRPLLALLLLIGGCAAPPPRVVVPAAAPAELPGAYYQGRAEQGAAILRVDAAGSLLTVEVRRAGALARLGHDHVVASHDLGGFVDTAAGRADLFVPLAALAVDEATLRAAAGFDTQPSAADIAGTRDNMLGKVLEVARYPYALIHVTGDPRDAHAPFKLALTLHGTTRERELPLEVTQDRDGLTVSGTLSMSQSEFGITPFAVLGGALAVRDQVDLHFRVRAVSPATTR